MNIKMLGDDTYIRQTRPEERMEVTDAGGQIISDAPFSPAEFTMVDARGRSQGGGIVPILLAVGAAWFVAKG